MVRSLITLAILCLPAVASANHGHRVVVQQVFVPLYYHNVSPYLQSEAQIRAIVRDEQQQLRQVQPLQQQAPVTLLGQKCASCHDGTKAFDMSKGITPDQIVGFFEMVGGHREPPAEMKSVIAKLKAENKAGPVTDELIALPRLSVQPQEGELK